MSESEQLLSFTFHWDFGEHARLTNFLTREYFSRGVWKFVGWGLLLLFVAGILFTILGALAGATRAALETAPWLVLIALWVWLLRRGTGWLQAWQVRRSDPNVKSPFTYQLADSGLQVKTRTADLELKWEGMYRVRERPEGFMFYYNARCAYQLPKRAVGGDDALRAVRSYIRSHLPPGVEFLSH